MNKRSSQSLSRRPAHLVCSGLNLHFGSLRRAGSRWFPGKRHLAGGKFLGGLLALALAACGCSMLTYTGPSGEHFTRCTFGSKTAIAALNVETGTNGIRRIELQGYQNDSTQALGTVTEAVVRAVMQAR